MKTLKILVGDSNAHSSILKTLVRNGYTLCPTPSKLKEAFKAENNAVVYTGTNLRSQRALWASQAPRHYNIDAIYLKGSEGTIEIPSEFEGFDSVRFING